MKRVVILTLIFLISLIAISAQADAMPEFTVTTIDGDVFDLDAALESYEAVLVNFFATWCGPCENEFPYMQEAYEAYSDRVAVLALSIEQEDDDQTLIAYRDEHGLTFPMANGYALDIWQRFVTTGIPTTALVDRFGNVVLVEVGAQSSAEPFKNAFAVVTAEDYTESVYMEHFPERLSSAEGSSAEELMAALNADGGDIRFQNAGSRLYEPWTVLTVDEEEIAGVLGQSGLDTESRLVASLEAQEGDALAFAFLTHVQPAYERLEIYIDGTRTKAFSGEHPWTEWAVPLSEGTHEVQFVCKLKADSAEGAYVYLNSVRLLSGEKAAEAVSANESYPVSQSTYLRPVNPDVRKIAFSDPQGYARAMFANYEFYIVSSPAELEFGFGPEIDPEAAVMLPMTSYGMFTWTDLDAQPVSVQVMTYAEDGFPCAVVALYPDANEDDFLGVCLFADAENCDIFADGYREHGYDLTWEYVEEESAIEGVRRYSVQVVDAEGNPVPGCIVNFCTDTTCVPVVSDESGAASLEAEAYPYHLQFLTAPEGYQLEGGWEYAMDAAGETVTLRLEKAE